MSAAIVVLTTYANLGQNGRAHTLTHTDCVDFLREEMRLGGGGRRNYLIMNIAFFGHTIWCASERQKERESWEIPLRALKGSTHTHTTHTTHTRLGRRFFHVAKHPELCAETLFFFFPFVL